jgi:hypothetical protein
MPGLCTQIERMQHPESTDPLWTECHMLRHVNRQECVVRLDNTGSVLLVGLQGPLDLTRACLVCATKPVPARIKLGIYTNGVFRDCELEVSWPPRPTSMPPPLRFIRKTRGVVPRKAKRRRIDQ